MSLASLIGMTAATPATASVHLDEPIALGSDGRIARLDVTFSGGNSRGAQSPGGKAHKARKKARTARGHAGRRSTPTWKSRRAR
jgi:hypothetical protein